jgi:hypothetical protein
LRAASQIQQIKLRMVALYQNEKVMVPQSTVVTFRPQATVLEPARGPAGTRIIPAELFAQLLMTVDNADTAFDAGFGRITRPAFAHGLKSRFGLCL